MTMLWNIEDVPNVYLTALCTWREARGCSDEAIRGVVHVIKNRATRPSWWGHGYPGVILKPYQFSSFNVGDPNATKFPADGDPVFKKILGIVERVIANQDEDLTGGATHYHDVSVSPDWAKSAIQVAKISQFTFYKES